jgi:hypothetical protein
MRRGDHRVAFLAQTTGRLQMIVRCSYPASVELLLLRAHLSQIRQIQRAS